MEQKKSARAEWLKRLAARTTPPSWGKAAEKLRGMQAYRNTATLFATPHESLLQVRINCLVDGKNLLMPGPSLREGFFLLAKRTVPFKDMPVAVTYKGLEKYGQRLKVDNMSELSAGLLLTDSLAVDGTGCRVGDGSGYFDLCCALLQELDGIGQDAGILTIILEEQVSREMLPQDLWDIKMTGAITPNRTIQFEPTDQKPHIFWDMLPKDKIKRINPLWKLFQKHEDKG